MFRTKTYALLCARRFSSNFFSFTDEVSTALSNGKGVVALESTVITHGLPFPKNIEVACGIEKIVRDSGATPATIALLDGKIHVGLCQKDLERIADPKHKPIKTSKRDIANVLAERAIGGTTVAATMWIAHQVLIYVQFLGFDISADLIELGRIPIAVVCAGAKSILDIPKTIEMLETLGVNVIVYGERSYFPGFFTRETPWKAPYNTNSLQKIANIIEYNETLASNSNCLNGATLVACPAPIGNDDDAQLIEKSIQQALREAERAKFTSNKEVTPFLLRRVNELTGSASLRINVALLENNAKVGAQLANLLSDRLKPETISSDRERSRVYSGEDIIMSQLASATPKVVCAGAAICDFEARTDVDNALSSEGAYHQGKIIQRSGGVGRNHADALSRLGIDAPFISAIGKDSFAEFLQSQSQHMNWQHVLKSTKSTASSMTLNVCGNIMAGIIDTEEIMAEVTPELVKSKKNVFSGSDFVLLDGNLRKDTTAMVFEMAEMSNTKVWFEPTNFLKVHKIFGETNLWKRASIVSPNANEFREFCRHLNLHLPENALLEANGLANYLNTNVSLVAKIFSGKLEHLLITIDKSGCVLLSKNYAGNIATYVVPPPQIRKDEFVSASGAGDCFNSGFLTGMLRNLDISDILPFATECARESLKTMNAVPDLESIILAMKSG
ncbi:indigoidine synthase A like protein domain-containing protein [Ditylenchus destructor]|uniref:Indigoidine synthase A like protein domain-containing protein n=1 Tax=Ditylenchus destructor TaxID=166010 RepID=A0AAD4MX07_9BILA|nr:indigoidine synthase A like protein domain-containing protein [Ditylenchus destructor]